VKKCIIIATTAFSCWNQNMVEKMWKIHQKIVKRCGNVVKWGGSDDGWCEMTKNSKNLMWKLNFQILESFGGA
jgi:hypothetical protein